jgi:hypothetical protein
MLSRPSYFVVVRRREALPRTPPQLYAATRDPCSLPRYRSRRRLALNTFFDDIADVSGRVGAVILLDETADAVKATNENANEIIDSVHAADRLLARGFAGNL